MKTLELSTIQLMNLNMLIALRDSVRSDSVAASCTFGLQSDQANLFKTLSTDQILTMVYHLGNESLFLPRKNISTYLEHPSPLLGQLLSVHPPQETISTSFSSTTKATVFMS